MAGRKARKLLEPGDAVGSYTVVSLLGQGGYGDIYAVKPPNSDDVYAMKLEAFTAEKRGLDSELAFIEQIQDSSFFPHLIEAGLTDSHRFVVIELLGPSLSNTRRQMPDHHYTLATVLRLAIFMAECIHSFHQHGFVHRDIKPGNFLLRPGSGNPVVLIDFGLSKEFIDPETQKPYPERSKVGFRGTTKYASLNAHRGRDQGPRDDMISWLYSVVELMDGRLPWGQDRDGVVISRKKSAISDRMLYRSLPHEFLEISYYLNSLGYMTRVNYDYIMCLLGRALRRSGCAINAPFDWEALPPEVVKEFAAIPTLPKASECAGSIRTVDQVPEEEDSAEDRCTFCAVI